MGLTFNSYPDRTLALIVSLNLTLTLAITLTLNPPLRQAHSRSPRVHTWGFAALSNMAVVDRPRLGLRLGLGLS